MELGPHAWIFKFQAKLFFCLILTKLDIIFVTSLYYCYYCKNAVEYTYNNLTAMLSQVFCPTSIWFIIKKCTLRKRGIFFWVPFRIAQGYVKRMALGNMHVLCSFVWSEFLETLELSKLYVICFTWYSFYQKLCRL